jgi:hypothetical protein
MAFAPRGKGIYARNPAFYPGGSPADYAHAMGCTFVAFLTPATKDAELRHAQDLGLGVYLWSYPETWEPDRWVDTLLAQSERVRRLGLDGFIADVEQGWASRIGDEQVGELGKALQHAAQTLPSVGFTSFPSWPHLESVAELAPLVWGSPQLYGVLEPGNDAELHRRAVRWRSAFKSVIPSLAAWSRTPAEQQSYLGGFRSESGALLWQTPSNDGLIRPQPGTLGFGVLRDWQPAGGSSGGGGGGSSAAGMLAGLLLLGAGWWWLRRRRG